jgi:hypothetical protein
MLAPVAICAITEVMSPAPTPISPNQVERLVAALRGEGRRDFAPLLEAVGANSIAEMSASQGVRAISWLQRKRVHGSPSQSSGPE